MLFKKYDKALWLILKYDKKNRKKILEFIKSIPFDFVINIQESIDEYNRYMIDNREIDLEDGYNRVFGGEIYTKDGFFYSYNIDTKNDMLYIGRSVYENGAYYNDFRLSLGLVDLNRDNLVNQNIGGVLSASLFEERFSINYDIYNTKIGVILLKYVNNNYYKLCAILNKDNVNNYNLEGIVKTKKKYKGERI